MPAERSFKAFLTLVCAPLPEPERSEVMTTLLEHMTLERFISLLPRAEFEYLLQGQHAWLAPTAERLARRVEKQHGQS